MATSAEVFQDEDYRHCVEMALQTRSGKQIVSQALAVSDYSPGSILQANSHVKVDIDRSDYVSTPALDEADETLQNTGYVILCGPPGSGKTTLASALARRSREQGFFPYVLERTEQLTSHIGKHERCVVVFDGVFGHVRVNGQQHDCWRLVQETVLELIKGGTCRLVITVFPHILRELQRLGKKWKSPLNDEKAIVRLTESLPAPVKEDLLHFHLDKLHLDPDLQHQVVEKVLQKDISGPVFAWCCDYMVNSWFALEDPTAVFVTPAEAYVQLLKDMVVDITYGSIFAAVLVLTMKRMSPFLHHPLQAASCLHELGFDPFSDDTLAAFKDILQGSVVFGGTFLSRVWYEAAGLALGRYFRLPILLKVCDIQFLMQYVHVSARDQQVSGQWSVSMCVTVGSVPSCSMDPEQCEEDLQELLERIFMEITQGNLQHIVQLHCLQYPQFLQELDKYCMKDSKRTKQLLNAVDPVHKLPLVYWSAFHPSHHLTHWCLSKMGASKTALTQLLMAFSLLDNVSQNSKCRVQPFLHRVSTSEDMGHADRVMDFPLLGTDQCLVPETQKCVKSLTGTEPGQRKLQYLCDPSLPIPPNIVTVHMSHHKLQLKVQDAHQWYLVFRLLTDRQVRQVDEDGNSLLQVARKSGNQAAVALYEQAEEEVETWPDMDDWTPDQHVRRQSSRTLSIRKIKNVDLIFRHMLDLDRTEVQRLLQGEISVEDKDSEGRTGLLVACREGREDIADIFIELGANVNAQERVPYRYALKTGMDVYDCSTPLHYACQKGMVRTVKLLTQHSADVFITTREGGTALHLASQCSSHTASAEITGLLLQAWPDVNRQDIYGNTPFHWAARNGHTHTAELLIHHDANVNTSNRAGNTPLLCAVMNSHCDIAATLINHAADVNVNNLSHRCCCFVLPTDRLFMDDPTTPLHYACKNGLVDTVRLLTDRQVNVTATTGNGDTALHFACLYPTPTVSADITRLLVQAGADVNARDKKGNTPLLCATWNDRKDTAQILMDHGAIVDKPVQRVARNIHLHDTDVLL